jgi:hypothetical protein
MPMTLTELEKHLKALRLHGMSRSLQARLLQAQQAGTTGLELIVALIQDELDLRLSCLVDRRFNSLLLPRPANEKNCKNCFARQSFW